MIVKNFTRTDKIKRRKPTAEKNSLPTVGLQAISFKKFDMSYIVAIERQQFI